MVGPMVGERRCAAPPLRGGNFSVLLLDRKVKTGRSLFLPLFRTLRSMKGIGGYERERDIKGEESGDQKGRFSWELVALSWSHAVLPSPMSVQDFAKSGTIEPFDYILTFVALLSEYIPVAMKLKKIEIYRKKLARSIISQNCFSRYIFLEFAIVLVTYQLIEEGGWLRGCDYDRTFSRGNRARHALAWLSVRWPSIIV